jgi:putative nucleotidyltransferase-like protein
MTSTTRLLAGLFKNCLHLGTNLCLIEQSLQRLRIVDGSALEDYFDQRETQLAPLLFWHLQQKGLTGLLDEPLARALVIRYQRNIARNALLERGLERVLDRFDRERIDTLVLKGGSVFTPELSAFRNAFVLSDIDLLVRPTDLQRAIDGLVADGHSLTDRQAASTGVKQGLASSDGVTRIDLHSALFWTIGGDYRDYGPGDLWERAVLGSFRGHRLATLSPEDQLCHRVVHDSVAHGEPILTSSTCRLYYLALLIDFYRDRIDWERLLQDLRSKQTDRLFVACVYHANRELGLRLPTEMEPLQRQARADLALLDAVTASTTRLADYGHRTSVALMTGRTRSEQLRRLRRLLLQDPVTGPLRAKETSGVSTMERFALLCKILCLQSAAVLFIGAAGFRHWLRKENAHVG